MSSKAANTDIKRELTRNRAAAGAPQGHDAASLPTQARTFALESDHLIGCCGKPKLQAPSLARLRDCLVSPVPLMSGWPFEKPPLDRIGEVRPPIGPIVNPLMGVVGDFSPHGLGRLYELRSVLP